MSQRLSVRAFPNGEPPPWAWLILCTSSATPPASTSTPLNFCLLPNPPFLCSGHPSPLFYLPLIICPCPPSAIWLPSSNVGPLPFSECHFVICSFQAETWLWDNSQLSESNSSLPPEHTHTYKTNRTWNNKENGLALVCPQKHKHISYVWLNN